MIAWITLFTALTPHYRSCLSKIVTQGYKALQLMYYFTSGEDEVKAWTIQKNTKAPQAAGRIHTDFEKGFIMADIMKFEDFKAEGSETAVKVITYIPFSPIYLFLSPLYIYPLPPYTYIPYLLIHLFPSSLTSIPFLPNIYSLPP